MKEFNLEPLITDIEQNYQNYQINDKIWSNYGELKALNLIPALTLIKKDITSLNRLVTPYQLGFCHNANYLLGNLKYWEFSFWIAPENLKNFNRFDLPQILSKLYPDHYLQFNEVLELIEKEQISFTFQEPIYCLRFLELNLKMGKRNLLLRDSLTGGLFWNSQSKTSVDDFSFDFTQPDWKIKFTYYLKNGSLQALSTT